MLNQIKKHPRVAAVLAVCGFIWGAFNLIESIYGVFVSEPLFNATHDAVSSVLPSITWGQAMAVWSTVSGLAILFGIYIFSVTHRTATLPPPTSLTDETKVSEVVPALRIDLRNVWFHLRRGRAMMALDAYQQGDTLYATCDLDIFAEQRVIAEIVELDFDGQRSKARNYMNRDKLWEDIHDTFREFRMGTSTESRFEFDVPIAVWPGKQSVFVRIFAAGGWLHSNTLVVDVPPIPPTPGTESDSPQVTL